MADIRIIEELRVTRQTKNLDQAELGAKLGIRQSQISKLESGAVDPRLSTVQDIARVLDLEIILIPRPLIPLVQSLIRRQVAPTEEQPIYALDSEDVPATSDTEIR